jgi:hypothetical protein
VLQRRRYFVFEFLAVYRGTTATGACRITALNHKIRYYTVEYEVIEVVALGKGGEIGACLGRMFGVELNGDGALELMLVICTATGI